MLLRLTRCSKCGTSVLVPVCILSIVLPVGLSVHRSFGRSVALFCLLARSLHTAAPPPHVAPQRGSVLYTKSPSISCDPGKQQGRQRRAQFGTAGLVGHIRMSRFIRAALLPTAGNVSRRPAITTLLHARALSDQARSFRVLGLQQIAVGAEAKDAMTEIWQVFCSTSSSAGP